MIPRSFWWESMRLFFVKCSHMLPVFFWDHFFEGLFGFVHGLLSQFRCCSSFAERRVWFFVFLDDLLPFFFSRRSCYLGFGFDTCYDYWLACFIQCCVLPMDYWFECHQPGVSQDYFVSSEVHDEEPEDLYFC